MPVTPVNGRVAFLASWDPHTYWELQNETTGGTNYGDDTSGNDNISGLVSGDFSTQESYNGMDTQNDPPQSGWLDIYTVTDAGCLLYIPAGLAHGTNYGVFHNGGNTSAQGIQLRASTTGVEIAGVHNTGGDVGDCVVDEIPDADLPGWFSVSVQFSSEGGTQGDMGLWINGTKVDSGTRGNQLAYGSGNPDLGNSSMREPNTGWTVGNTTPSDWSGNTNINGSGILIANFWADNANTTNSSPPGLGDTAHLDFYSTHTTGSGPGEGSATGSTVFVGSASGTAPSIPPNEGSASGTTVFSSSSVGERIPKGFNVVDGEAPDTVSSELFDGGTPSSQTSDLIDGLGPIQGTIFLGTASGEMPLAGTKEGSSTGSTVYAGSASGKHISDGSSTGSMVYSGSASGIAPVLGVNQGSSTGSTVYAGSASGKHISEGSATGSTVYSGSASGKHISEGSSTGSTVYSGSASGKHISEGSSTGSTVYAGSASGIAPVLGVNQGSSTGSTVYAGSASGKHISEGSSTGSTVYSGYSLGQRESIGTSTGATTFVGTSSGASGNSGSASGETTYVSAAIGKRRPKASASGETIITSYALGAFKATGTGSGFTSRASSAAGIFDPLGYALGVSTYIGTALGQSNKPHDSLVISVLLPRRWDGLVLSGRWEGNLLPRQWDARLSSRRWDSELPPQRWEGHLQ